MNKKNLIEFLTSLDLYNDYYGGNAIDQVISHLDDFFAKIEENEAYEKAKKMLEEERGCNGKND